MDEIDLQSIPYNIFPHKHQEEYLFFDFPNWQWTIFKMHLFYCFWYHVQDLSYFHMIYLTIKEFLTFMFNGKTATKMLENWDMCLKIHFKHYMWNIVRLWKVHVLFLLCMLYAKLSYLQVLWVTDKSDTTHTTDNNVIKGS